jgi:hypothetical protein
MIDRSNDEPDVGEHLRGIVMKREVCAPAKRDGDQRQLAAADRRILHTGHRDTENRSDCAEVDLTGGFGGGIPYGAVKGRTIGGGWHLDELESGHQRVSRLEFHNDLAIERSLRGCDVVSLRVEEDAPYAVDRATVHQNKTGQPVKFEMTEQTREAIRNYISVAKNKPGGFLFGGRRGRGRTDPGVFGTHSLRRRRATLIYRRTGNLRAVQLRLGHKKIESTVRYLGIEVDDALAIAERVNV